MTPEGGRALKKIAGLRRQPGRNYKIHFDRNRVYGICDGKEAMEQVIYKILNTERYRYLIYSRNYGIELQELFGMPVSYVCPELERRIREALLVDDRITGVKDFVFDVSSPHKVHAAFVAETLSGSVPAEKEVEV